MPVVGPGTHTSSGLVKDPVAICYVTDVGFLRPTLMSSLSVRRFVRPETAPIFIFTHDVDVHAFSGLEEFTASSNIKVIEIPDAYFSSLDLSYWAESHVPYTSFGRFFISEILPPEIRRIIYLDGDTMVVDDPGKLVEFIVPADKLAAAEDSVFVRRSEESAFGRKIAKYLDGIGVKDISGYFNSGVLAATRSTWSDLSREAVAFYTLHPNLCLFHDQSALNAIIGSRRCRISSRWNYQSRMKEWGLRLQSPISIVHFTGYPKPWMGFFPPWLEYRSVVSDLSAQTQPFGLPSFVLDQSDIDRRYIESRSVQLRLRSLVNYRRVIRRADLLAIEAKAEI